MSNGIFLIMKKIGEDHGKEENVLKLTAKGQNIKKIPCLSQGNFMMSSSKSHDIDMKYYSRTN